MVALPQQPRAVQRQIDTGAKAADGIGRIAHSPRMNLTLAFMFFTFIHHGQPLIINQKEATILRHLARDH